MTEREAFIVAINADLTNDFPRLMFADWLDERGDPLGEFIRLQIRLHHEGTASRTIQSDPYSWLYERGEILTGQLWQQCADMIAKNTLEWTAYLPERCNVRGWSRGFPGFIQIKTAAWNAHAEKIIAAQPVEKVLLRGKLAVQSRAVPGYYLPGTFVHVPAHAEWRYEGRGWVQAERHPAKAREVLWKAYWPNIKFV